MIVLYWTATVRTPPFGSACSHTATRAQPRSVRPELRTNGASHVATQLVLVTPESGPPMRTHAKSRVSVPPVFAREKPSMRNPVSEGRRARRWREPTSNHGTVIVTHRNRQRAPIWERPPASPHAPPHLQALDTTLARRACVSAPLSRNCKRMRDSRLAEGLERMATAEMVVWKMGLDRHPGAAKVPK
jgi:hypothetical protein